MPRVGPCVNPECVDAENASGQWTTVPEPFATVQGVSGRCVCKKAACRRWCGLKHEKQKPGRKRGFSEEAGASAAGTSNGVLPRPPWIRSIDQIWGVRCGVHALACDFPHISRPLPSCLVSLFFLFSLRYADIDDLDEVTRSNLLPYPPAVALEYAVHGKYARTADDSNGVWGTWYIGLRELVQVFGKDEVATKLAEFEEEQKQAREEALEDIEIVEEGEEQEEAAAPA